MSIEERDAYTGHLTTGHEWNGIKELNTPVPFIVIFFLIATFIFSVGYWILMPAWPSVTSYTKGKLGFDQRETVDQQIRESMAIQSHWANVLLTQDLTESAKNPELVSIIKETGPALFQDNCSMCHGQQGDGALFFPRLTDNNWLWGNQPDDILTTLKTGINADTPGTRMGVMPAFGNLGILKSEEIKQTAIYVMSLSNPSIGSGKRVKELLDFKKGKTIFQTNCAACHGPKGFGNPLLGAPNLTDAYWVYGGDLDSVSSTLSSGRAGHMPAWEGRLSEIELRILALYVVGLSNSQTSSVK